MFDSEGSRLKEEIESLQIKIKELELKQTEIINSYEDKIKEKIKHIDYLDGLNQDQLENHENEVRTLKQLLEHQKSELESEKIRSRERDQRNQETIDDLKTDNNSLRDTLSRERS
jgi:hypothetical protein